MVPTLDPQRLSIAPIPRDGNSRPHQIAARLREKFLSGSLQPGDRVPSERDLAVALQVSRTALREAFRILEAEGLLNVVHGRGTFVVKADSPTIVARRTVGAPTMVSKEIHDLMRVRRILESEAAALAARRIRGPQLAALRKILGRGALLANRPAPDLERLSQLNRKFHLALLAASGNAAIARISASIFDLLRENSDLFINRSEWALRSWTEGGDHYRIVQAIAAGDAESARALMRDHLEYG
jgi:DNA-binding FadR family transcriptional regulator